jgi:hypothetical protein
MLMKSEKSPIIQKISDINYSYEAVKITQSRIDKGLLSIPQSIVNWFPQNSRKIKILLDNSDEIKIKNYSSFSSSTKESRIGGLREWIEKNKFSDGDEIVIQVIDKERYIYRLTPEKLFINQIKEFQNDFDSSESENDASRKMKSLSKLVDLDEQKTSIHEYFRIIKITTIEKRQYVSRNSAKAKESVPSSLRLILGKVYNGICQVCGFYFLKRDNNPYFEIHHLDALKGNHPKNLILVCANCHRQFEFANVFPAFNEQGWLIKVVFNKNQFDVNQIIEKERPEEYVKKIHI